MSDPAGTPDSHPFDLVPDTWPAARFDTPTPVHTIRGLAALPGMVFLWFFPKRLGASLAGSGWRAAVAAHLLGITMGSGFIIWAEVLPWTAPVAMTPVAVGRSSISFDLAFPARKMALVEYVTAPLAALAISAHALSATGGSLVNPALVLLGIESACMVMALAMMAFAAAGEPAGRLFGRCLRLSWWSTTMFIPLGVGWLLNPVFRQWYERPDEWLTDAYLASALFAIWWLIVLLRSGYRYAGPPSGPAWETRIPRCEGCGYIIAHIPLTTNCPECGRPVAESLPERRRAPAYVTAKTLIESHRMYWATLREVVLDGGFFGWLSVHRDPTRDRRFFLWTCALNALWISLGIVGIALLVHGKPVSKEPEEYALIIAVVCFLSQVILAGIAAVVAAALGRRTVQSSAVATFWGMTGLLPIAAGCLLFVLTLGLTIAASELFLGDYPVALFAIVISTTIVFVGFPSARLVLVGAKCLGRAFLRTRRASA